MAPRGAGAASSRDLHTSPPGRKDASATKPHRRSCSHRDRSTSRRAASPAAADTLLSGYGGPGSGSQTLLGATLLGGSPGQGGSGGGAPAEGEHLTQEIEAASAALGDRHARAQRFAVVPRRPSPAGRPASPSATRAQSTRAAPAGSQTLGLTASDRIDVILALAALALTAVLTARLARGSRSAEPDRSAQATAH